MQSRLYACLPPKKRLEDRHRLARLALAWLANMQVMMFAFPGYFLDDTATAVGELSVLRQAVIVMNWISLALTVPVVFYCAWPLWRGACRRAHDGISMDVPVVLSMLAAFIPSAYATWAGHGTVYFESVTMFVAFVLTARYLEYRARHGMRDKQTCLEPLRLVLSQLAQRLAFWFVLVQVGLAVLAGAFWLVWEPTHALPVTVALLVMSCPCAMAMAVPVTMASAHACLQQCVPMSDQAMTHLVQMSARVSRQNLLGAILWHLLMTPLAAIGLVQPWLAAIVMLVSSLAVAVNAWRIYHSFMRRNHTANDAWLCVPVQGS